MKPAFDDSLFSVGEAKTAALTETRFPCQQCGAMLHYAIGTNSLECRYCGHFNRIVDKRVQIDELDYHEALLKLQTSKKIRPETNIIQCPNCAAQFAMDAHIHAGECPFCSTNVVTSTSHAKPIKPKALLPFKITADQAKASYERWLSKLWFAPNELKKFSRSDTSLNGVYIPYWTYDSDTVTAYSGERGDVYYVTQMVTVVVDGRRVRRRRQVPKIRWTPVSGRTNRHFDDVLVGATRTLPRKITDWLEPWDLENLLPYTEEYLSGFSSEVYQVELDQGFNHAQTNMDRIIKGDVKRSIGGDQQRIRRLQTTHSETTFKHVLLPLWSAAFDFRGKTYRFVVNGRTGKVRGERPYSVVKIALAVVAGGAMLIGGVSAMYSSQSGLSSGFGSPFSDGIRIDWSSEPAPSRWPEVPFGNDRMQFPELPPNFRF
jgi:DNA-directed RNA polymerase subunit RPC12/RpoP